MKRISKLLAWAFTGAVLLLSTACIQCDSEEIRITLNENLSGTITFVVKNISSSENTAEARGTEMNGFFADLAKLPDDLKEFGLKDTTIDLTNQTSLTCDAVVKGSFDNILTILPLLGEIDRDDFEASRVGNTFTLRIRAKGLVSDSPNLLSIEYSGELVGDNASSSDTETRTLQWKPRDKGNTGIYFSLKLPARN